MTRTTTRIAAVTALVALGTLGMTATASARHGADDAPAPSVTVVDDHGGDRVRADDGRRGRGRGSDDASGHQRRGRGSDDASGHQRRGRGSDDGPGHQRHGRGSDDGPNHS